MKKLNKKTLSVSMAIVFMSSNLWAETKTLDFYSSNGVNRYSISGKISELNFPVSNNSILITQANNEAYVKLGNLTPYNVRFLEQDLNIYQIIEANKGKNILYKGQNVKLLGAQNDKIVIQKDDAIMFVALDDISVPKDFINDSQKGLKVSFARDINSDDILFFSQPERQLSYSNSYDAIVHNDSVSLSHYLNINNMSGTTYDNVYLNFFLSETNIDNSVLRPMPQMVRAMAAAPISDINEAPEFENDVIQNLKSISISKPTTIYPNFNKIKYSEKNYMLKQYAKIDIQENYDIYLGDVIDKDLTNLKDLKVQGTALNDIYMERINRIKKNILSVQVRNFMDIKTDGEDILPSGKISIYEEVNKQDKLIVSTNINHTERKNIEIFKNKNNDLKILDVQFTDVNNALGARNWQELKTLKLKIKSIEIENLSALPYTVKVMGQEIVIKGHQKVKL